MRFHYSIRSSVSDRVKWSEDYVSDRSRWTSTKEMSRRSNISKSAARQDLHDDDLHRYRIHRIHRVDRNDNRKIQKLWWKKRWNGRKYVKKVYTEKRKNKEEMFIQWDYVDVGDSLSLPSFQIYIVHFSLTFLAADCAHWWGFISFQSLSPVAEKFSVRAAILNNSNISVGSLIWPTLSI